MMKLSSVPLLLLFAMTAGAFLVCEVEGRPVPNFGQRRLLNLTGSGDEFSEFPVELTLPPGNTVLVCLSGQGSLEYAYNGSSWGVSNVSAELITFDGQTAGLIYYLPHKDPLGGQCTWQSLAPTSLVTGISRGEAAVDADSIPWVLFEATSNSGDVSTFGAVTYVQLLYSSKGLPPSVPGKPGDLFQAEYSATYCFSKKTS